MHQTVIQKAPRDWPNKRYGHKYYDLTVTIESSDARPEGLWDITYEIQSAIEARFGDGLVGVTQPGVSRLARFERDIDRIRYEPRYSARVE